MNRLNLGFAGGMPVTQNLLQFVEDNVKFLTSAIIKPLALGNDFVKLYGVDVTVSDSGGVAPLLSYTEGVIWYLDEIYFVEAVTNLPLTSGTTLSEVLTTYSFDLVEDYSTSIVYKNGTSRDAFYYRYAAISASPSTWIGVDVDMPSIAENLASEATSSTFGTVKLADNTSIVSTTSNAVITPKSIKDKQYDLTAVAGANTNILEQRIKVSIVSNVKTIDLMMKVKATAGSIDRLAFTVPENYLLAPISLAGASEYAYSVGVTVSATSIAQGFLLVQNGATTIELIKVGTVDMSLKDEFIINIQASKIL